MRPIRDEDVIEVIRTFIRKEMLRGHVRLHLPEPFDRSFPLQQVGIDSLLIAELVMDIEARFDIELPFARLSSAETIGEFIDEVCATPLAA